MGITGTSPAIRRVQLKARKAAPQPYPLLLHGPSGSGKEVLARAIHCWSGRKGPFKALNCASLSGQLVDAELFGHQKGAFTGATNARTGLFGAAEGGTLFLDEIGELELESQSKLLRVLQELSIRRVGDSDEVKIDVRVIAATHQDLKRLVREKRFREDLLYRLSHCILELPALKERESDVILIARQLLLTDPALTSRKMRLTREATRVLTWYDWPGNVRELQAVLHEATLRARGRRLLPRHLLAVLRERGMVEPSPSSSELAVTLLEAIRKSGNALTRDLARATGVSRSSATRKLRELVKDGLITREGAGPNVRYQTVSPLQKPIS